MKHLARMVLISIIPFAVFMVMLYGEIDFILEPRVSPASNMSSQEWLQTFRQLAIYGIIASWIVTIIWYDLGQWFFKVNDWRAANRRAVWGLLFLVPVGAFALTSYFTPQAQEGAFWAYLFYFVNNVTIYYLGTVLLSPPAFMYTPLGATVIRHWR